jgi:hypothetical protein
VTLVAVLVLGRLITWTLQTSTLTQRLWRRHQILTELGECDFCLGFWVFLGIVIPLNFDWLGLPHYSGLTEFLNALSLSFVAHLVRLGWTMKFGVFDLSE